MLPTSITRIVALLIVAALPSLASAHAGGLDKEGCHNDKKARERHCHPERLIARKLATCELVKPPKAGDEGVFFGRFVRTVDGDTFHAKVQGVVMDFRLAEADAPETRQPYGDVAAKELESLLSDRNLVLVPFDTDAYGRTVAFVWVGSMCINKELVRRGAAWFYDEYSNDNALQWVEDEARDAKLGLWALPPRKRMEPWVFRQEKR